MFKDEAERAARDVGEHELCAVTLRYRTARAKRSFGRSERIRNKRLELGNRFRSELRLDPVRADYGPAPEEQPDSSARRRSRFAFPTPPVPIFAPAGTLQLPSRN